MTKAMKGKLAKNARVKRALDATEAVVEKAYDVVQTTDFIEVIGTTGGDAVTYRAYDDGTITMKQKEEE